MEKLFMTFILKIIFYSFSMFLSVQINAQADSAIFTFNNLGSFNIDMTYGGFDGGLGKLKVTISDYLYSKNNNSLIVRGKVCDYHTDETFCNISLYIATTEPYLKKIKKNTFLEMNKLKVKRSYKVDCLGNFDIKIDLGEDEKFYFGIFGFSLLECTINKINLK
jgi:hypothetical protein